jgi:signal transduction histidine kinase/ActR/RegA family two-component response regulator
MMCDFPNELLRRGAIDEEHHRRLTELQLHSYIMAPLKARGRMLGVVTLVLAESERRFTSEDLSLAQELAHRAALAIDNARLYQELRDADRRKDEFLAMLAHELRNPLAPMRTAAEVMRLRGFENPELVWARDLMERQTGTLARLVDDLLDVSRITRGKIQLRKERLELSAFVRRMGEAYGPSVRERRHELEVRLPDRPVWVDADPMRLEQVVGNLLNNAAKYTEPGGTITLTLETVPREPGHRRGGAKAAPEAVIRVRDTGIGIAPELLSRVFELFTQADRTLDRAQGGLGIGLTLVRTLTEMHGGQVEAASAGPGQGSEFRIRLPAVDQPARPSREEARPAPPPERADVSARERVLVVDDNEDAAETLAELLELWGYQAIIAHDGETGLQVARRFAPEIAILDIGLPRMDGYELARRLRTSEQDEAGWQQDEESSTLLIALTGYGQEEDRRKALEAGFDHHFTKPVDIEGLRRALESSRFEALVSG